MQFLADERCDFAVVRAVRAAGHDVVAVSELNEVLMTSASNPRHRRSNGCRPR